MGTLVVILAQIPDGRIDPHEWLVFFIAGGACALVIILWSVPIILWLVTIIRQLVMNIIRQLVNKEDE